jgi:aldose 1-epimerase
MSPALEQVRLSNETIDLVLLPGVGARLHRLRAFGHDVLRTPPDPRIHQSDPFAWGAYVMAPWGGRIEAGSQVVGRRRVELTSNFPDGSAIHGQVYARTWDPDEQGGYRIRAGGDGWPWSYVVTLRFDIADRTVIINQAIINTSPDAMPAGVGIHPWFRRPLRVRIRGHEVYPNNLATAARPEPVYGRLDLREPGEMAPDLDGTWTALDDPPVELRWPGSDVSMSMRTIPPTTHIVAASPHEVGAIAIEPQTHAPQGLRRLLGGEPGALTMLGPGETLTQIVELAFDRSGANEMMQPTSAVRPHSAAQPP